MLEECWKKTRKITKKCCKNVRKMLKKTRKKVLEKTRKERKTDRAKIKVLTHIRTKLQKELHLTKKQFDLLTLE